MTNISQEEARQRIEHLEGCIALFEAMAFFLDARGALPLSQFLDYLKGCHTNLPDDAQGERVRMVFLRVITDLEHGINHAHRPKTGAPPAWLHGVIQGGGK